MTAGDRVFRRPGDRGKKVLVRGFSGVDTVAAAQAQNHDPVGHGAHVFHVVTDDDDAQAPVAHPLDQVQDLGGLRDSQCGRRFVQHDDPGLQKQRPRNGHGLPLTA